MPRTDCPLGGYYLCKGQVLMDYIKDKNYQKVSYFGDGFNDFCPATKLRKNDHVFPRKEFACDRKIQENKNAVQAKVQSWENGIDLLVHLKNKAWAMKSLQKHIIFCTWFWFLITNKDYQYLLT